MKHLLRLFALALLLVSTQACAHRFHAGITDIAFNARTGNTEIVHTYMAHDVEALLANLYGRQFDLSDPEDQEAVRKYVEGRFRVLDQNKTPLAVRWVGMTADPEKITVFQEIEQTPLWKAGAIHDNVLIDFLPDQVNTVNLNEGNAVRTLSFDRNKLEQSTR
ncbi:DUF6702 family protein [Massilia sp. Leaf139]|uniref:DUF6702 family protein n=1 Tax=Massilia sp. Leaf139 TaxID=1736272 RepID=UPI0006F6CB34|nr:DUF6702 family protein [Massilia sp. Leaf139]KQQ87823.1 hypothetical protein ASF77_13875 [Massilia sp. Leaf139]